jgi:hypothetical protein
VEVKGSGVNGEGRGGEVLGALMWGGEGFFSLGCWGVVLLLLLAPALLTLEANRAGFATKASSVWLVDLFLLRPLFPAAGERMEWFSMDFLFLFSMYLFVPGEGNACDVAVVMWAGSVFTEIPMVCYQATSTFAVRDQDGMKEEARVCFFGRSIGSVDLGRLECSVGHILSFCVFGITSDTYIRNLSSHDEDRNNIRPRQLGEYRRGDDASSLTE